MVGFLNLIVAAAIASASVANAGKQVTLGHHSPKILTLFCLSITFVALALVPGCVTINGVRFCSDAKTNLVVSPNGCVSINDVKFCTVAPAKRSESRELNSFAKIFGSN